MTIKANILIGLVILVIAIIGLTILYNNTPPPDTTHRQANQTAKDYDPQINPADFSTKITNKYFTLPIGRKMVFESRLENGVNEKIEIEILKEKKLIGGVETIVYLDKVYNDEQLVEETRDYLAQHKNGDVWYFGEDVNNFENSKLKDHHGTFLHGKDGAKAGIWMKAEQKVGDSYRQEYYPGEAEDMRDIIATNVAVSTKLGKYTGCVIAYDWTPLEPTSREYKYYCPQTGSLVLNQDLGTGDRSELTSITSP